MASYDVASNSCQALVGGESIHVTFERHTQTTCDPTKYPSKRNRCPVPGCKEKLTTVNVYKCKACRVEVCIKHRFGKDHGRGGIENTHSIDVESTNRVRASV